MTRLLLTLALALVAGCATGLPDRPPPPGVSEKQHVLDTLAVDLDGWRTLRASVEGEAAFGSFAGVLLVDRGRRALHLLAWRPASGLPVLDLLVREGTARLAVPWSSKVLVRKIGDCGGHVACTEARVQYLREALRWGRLRDVEFALSRSAGGSACTYREATPLDALVATLFAEFPCSAPEAPPRVVLPGHDEAWIVSEAGHGHLEIELGTLALLSVTLDDTRIEYTEHEALAGGRYAPRAIDLRTTDDEVMPMEAVTLRLSDITWDAPIDARKLEQRTPPGAAEVQTYAELALE